MTRLYPAELDPSLWQRFKDAVSGLAWKTVGWRIHSWRQGRLMRRYKKLTSTDAGRKP